MEYQMSVKANLKFKYLDLARAHYAIFGERTGEILIYVMSFTLFLLDSCLMFCKTINIGKMSLNFLQAAGFYYTSIDTRHYIKLKQKIHSFCSVFQSFFS